MASQKKYDIDSLKELKNKIMRLQENEYYEILKIIIKNNKKYVKFFSNLNQLNYVQVNK